MRLDKKLEDSIDRLSRLGTQPDEFKIWLKRFLIKKISHPLTGYYRNEPPYSYLYRINEATDSERFQERLRHAVKELFKDWNINARNTETIEYFSSLLNLIAELPVTEMYPELIEIAYAGPYCGVISGSEEIDVQTLILQVIAGMQVPSDEKVKDRLMDIVEKYIHDHKYTQLCFRIAWQTRHDNAIQYIRPILEFSYNRRFDIGGAMERFLSECRVANFKNFLVPMLEKIQTNDNKMQKYFLEILSKLGVRVRIPNFPPDPQYLLMTWDTYDQMLFKERILCENQNIMNLVEESGPFDNNVQERDKKFLDFISGILGTGIKGD